MADPSERALPRANARLAFGALLLCAAGGCVEPEPLGPPEQPLVQRPADPLEGSDSILVAGRRFAVDARVVTFLEPGGYDASSPRLHFARERAPGTPTPHGLRYLPGRDRETGRARFDQSFAEIAAAVDLVVLHYDACGTSRRCFEVLHDVRGLSAHFLVDLDGTIYQTLDLADTAWHAGPVNARSIGIEIAHVGAEAPDDTRASDAWYREGPDGVHIVAPGDVEVDGAAASGTLQPARRDRVWGLVQGRVLVQYDFTPEQYAALAALIGALAEIFPAVARDVPREADGAVVARVLTDLELAAFRGVVGHWHVSAEKIDPGPAFQWERALGSAAR